MRALERFRKRAAVILFILITAIMIVLFYDFYLLVIKHTKIDTEEHLKLNTVTSALMVREKIQGDLHMAYALSGLISGFEPIDSPEAKIFLKVVGNQLPFSVVMVSNLNGDFYTTNGGSINIQEPHYLLGLTSGDKNISVIYENALYGRDMISLDSSIWQNGRVVGKVSGLYYTNYINNILDNAADGNGNQYQIIDRSGNFILPSGMSVFYEYQNLHSFLDSVSFPKGSSADHIIQDFIKRKSGVSAFIINGEDNYISYAPIGFKDWYLISTAPDTGISLRTIFMQNPTLIFASRIIILFLVLILYIVWRQLRYRTRMENNRKELEILNESLQVKNESLKLKAENDLLTGLYNKVTSEFVISDYLSNEGKEGRHALIIIDLDDFKKINDELGHLYGDLALTEAASCIDRCLSTAEVKGRIGGDEFIVLLGNIESDEDLERSTAMLCRCLKEIRLTTEDTEWKLSGSIGVAIYPDHAVQFKDLFLKADKAMYCSKEHGKGLYYIYQ